VALHVIHDNFRRLHQTLRVPSAMDAGVTAHLWEMADLVRLVDDFASI